MFAFKFLMLCGLICVSMSSESSEEVERILENPKLAPFLKQQVKKYYENNKLKAISDIFESVLGQLPNLTFVAWQNVYDTKGNVVEIRTIELFFPGIGNSSDLLNNDEDDDDEGLEEIQNKYFPLMSKAGIRLEAGNEEYDKEGTLESFSYIDSFNTYAFTDGIYLVNKTIEVDNKSEIDQKIEEFRKGPNPVTVLTFDKENKFIPAESVVVPTYLASITDYSGDVSQAIVDTALEALTNSFLTYRNDPDQIIPKISEYLSTKLPGFDFSVIENEPEASYMEEDFKLVAQYDFSLFDPLLTVTIFGDVKTAVS